MRLCTYANVSIYYYIVKKPKQGKGVVCLRFAREASIVTAYFETLSLSPPPHFQGYLRFFL